MKSICYSAVIGCLAIVMFTACSNKENDTPKPKTGTELLAGDVSKSWLFKDGSLVMSGTVNMTFDMKQSTPACDLDDLIIYKRDGKIAHDEGATKCAATDPQTEDRGTWVLSDDGKKLTFTDKTGTKQEQEVIELTESSFKTKWTIAINGTNAVYNFSYSAK
jgi:hypothetical protein